MNYRVNKKEASSTQKPSPILLPKKSNIFAAAILSVLCALCFAFHIYLVFSTNAAITGLALSLVFGASYAGVVCCNKSTALKILPLAAGLVSVVVSVLLFDVTPKIIVNVLLAVIFDITLCMCLIYSALKGFSRAFTIATVSAGVVVNVLLSIIALFLLKYGTFSIDLMLTKLNALIDTTKHELILQTKLLLENQEFAASLKQALTTAGSQMSNEEVVELMKTSSTYVLESAKLMLPSMLGIYAVAVSAVAASLLYVCTKACNTKIYYGRKWPFVISTTGAELYNILFFAALIGGLFGIPQELYVACINFVAIFTPVFCYVATRDIVELFKKKGKKTFSAALITFALIVLATSIIGPSSFMLLSLIGVYTTKAKQRIRFVIYKD